MQNLQILTQEILKQNLHYNPETGLFNWIKGNNQIKIGDTAGCLHKVRSYISIKINGKDYLAHRLAWLYVHGEMPADQIDHVNHDKTDNRIANLRAVTNQENHQNRTINSNNTSGFMGVNWYKPTQKWHARIMIDGKNKHLGYFTNQADAIVARQIANVKYGFHENHGIVA